MKRWIALVAVLAMTLAACGGSDDGGSDDTSAPGGVGDAVAGEEIVTGPCAACHAPDSTGIDGLGPDLHHNEFIISQSDDELVTFLKNGRATDDPDNTTGVAMPPNGGDPSLSEDDLLDAVAYLRTLQ